MSKSHNSQSRNRVRMSFTLPPSVQNDLSYISMRLHISKSAILAHILEKPLPLFVSLLRQIPPDMPANDLAQARVIRNFKNNSRQAIADELHNLDAQILSFPESPPSGDSL